MGWGVCIKLISVVVVDNGFYIELSDQIVSLCVWHIPRCVSRGGGPRGLPPPLEIEKQKKKKLPDFGPPLLRIPGHAPDTSMQV